MNLYGCWNMVKGTKFKNEDSTNLYCIKGRSKDFIGYDSKKIYVVTFGNNGAQLFSIKYEDIDIDILENNWDYIERCNITSNWINDRIDFIEYNKLLGNKFEFIEDDFDKSVADYIIDMYKKLEKSIKIKRIKNKLP